MTGFLVILYVIVTACLIRPFIKAEEVIDTEIGLWAASLFLGPLVGFLVIFVVGMLGILAYEHSFNVLTALLTFTIFVLVLALIRFQKKGSLRVLFKEKFGAKFLSPKPKELTSPISAPIKRSVYEIIEE